MIQDILPKKFYNQYNPNAEVQAKDQVMVFAQGKLLIKEGENREIVFPTALEYGMERSYIYLFSIDEERFFLAGDVLEACEDTQEGCGDYHFEEFRMLREKFLGPKYKMMAIYTAKHLMDWYRDSQFCGRCGNKMQHSEKERAMKCACGYTAYPRIMPAVIVGVINGDKLLLTKYRQGYQHYALVAGFTEIGETMEETVAREVMEEAGLKVKNIRYYKSQPWGSANDILLGYYCEVDGDTQIHMDKDELKFAQWLSRDEIELQPDDFSLTNEMMMQFKEVKIVALENK